MPYNVIAAITNLFTGLLVLGFCIPLLKDKIPRNYVYGMRTAKALASDEAWYVINRYGARRMIAWSIIDIAVGVVALFVPMGEVAAVIVAFIPITVLIPCIDISIYSSRYEPGASTTTPRL